MKPVKYLMLSLLGMSLHVSAQTTVDDAWVRATVPGQPSSGALTQPVQPWEGVREAKAFGDDPMQLDVFGDMNFRGSGRSEDKLSEIFLRGNGKIWRQHLYFVLTRTLPTRRGVNF